MIDDPNLDIIELATKYINRYCDMLMRGEITSQESWEKAIGMFCSKCDWPEESHIDGKCLFCADTYTPWSTEMVRAMHQAYWGECNRVV